MNYMIERFKATGSTVMQFATTGDGGAYAGYVPTPGVAVISVLAIIKMANAADMTLTLKTDDDGAGTNATALTENVPIWKNWVRLAADAKAITETAATGTFIYAFQVPAIIIPDDKYLSIASDAGNAANVYTAFAMEDVYNKG